MPRFIAALVIVILAGLPVAGVVCAHECLTPIDSSATTEEPCHDPGPTEDESIRGVVSEGCSSPLAFADAATRDRVSAPIGPAPLALPAYERSSLLHQPPAPFARTTTSPRSGASRIAGSPIPLRL